MCGCGVLGFACCWVGGFWELDARVVSFRCCLLGSRFMALGVRGISYFIGLCLFCALGLRLFDGSGFESMHVLGVLGVSLFDPMTLKPGSAASRSVNNYNKKKTPIYIYI